jgi:tryptophan synthase
LCIHLSLQILFLGYYNPIMSHGEEKAVQDAKDAGANGFILVDLPPEEAIKFREICTSTGFVRFGIRQVDPLLICSCVP